MARRSKQPNPDGSKLEDWIEPINARGVFAKIRPDQKGMVERLTAGDFAAAMYGEFGIDITDIKEGADPPDVVARIGDRAVSLELAELVKPHVRKKKALRATKGVPYEGDEFAESQWTQAEFVSRIGERLDAKNSLYAKSASNFVADALVIHTNELWLSWRDVGGWIASASFSPRPTLRSAYLLLFHDPSYGRQHWPIFRLYGDVSL